MIYDELSIRELQAECKERGLLSGRARDELIQRLQEDDQEGYSLQALEAREPEPVSVPDPEPTPEATPEIHVEPGTEAWLNAQGDFMVAFRFNGALTPARHVAFTVQAQALAEFAGHRVVSEPTLVLNQGAHVKYRVGVAGE